MLCFCLKILSDASHYASIPGPRISLLTFSQILHLSTLFHEKVPGWLLLDSIPGKTAQIRNLVYLSRAPELISLCFRVALLQGHLRIQCHFIGRIILSWRTNKFSITNIHVMSHYQAYPDATSGTDLCYRANASFLKPPYIPFL